MKARHDLDPSVAFTVLLELMPGYAESTGDSDGMVSRFLADWYEDPGTDMAAFARVWGAHPANRARLGGHKPESNPVMGFTGTERWTCSECGASVIRYQGNVYGDAIKFSCTEAAVRYARAEGNARAVRHWIEGFN